MNLVAYTLIEKRTKLQRGRSFDLQDRAWLADVARGLAAIKPPGIPDLSDADLFQAAVDQLKIEQIARRLSQ